jgi:DNA mismatch repair protein MutS
LKDILKIIDLLDRAIKENPEISLTSGEIIADFYNDKIDEYRNIINNSKNWLVLYQNKLIDETNILNLKVKYTSVFGYFIEVTKSHTYKVPDYFIPKQTLV